MTADKSIVPEGKDTFTEDDWATATEQVRATRDRVLTEHPTAAAAADRVYGEIASRVHTLAAIRKARGLTQQQISAQLNISQAEVSRFERRSNLHLDTLTRFIEAIGGQLRITAVFDDTQVEVGIGDLLEAEPSSGAGGTIALNPALLAPEWREFPVASPEHLHQSSYGPVVCDEADFQGGNPVQTKGTSMGNRQKPGETPGRPGEYRETGPHGGEVKNPREVTMEKGDKPLPPTSEKGNTWKRTGPPRP